MTARFYPVHSCGHDGRSMPDTASSHAYATEHVSTVPCWSCDRAERDEMAREMTRTLGLPELVAKSEKQERYAIVSREDLRQRMDALVTSAPSWMPYADAALYGITDASWWIDRREQEATDALAWIVPVVDQVRSSIQ